MENALQAIEVARESGKIRKGVNEVTKAVERQNAELVVIADDVSPKELVMHLPILCEEKGVECVEDACGKEELGAAAGLAVSTVAVAITKVGNAKDLMQEVKAELKAEAEPAPEPEESEEPAEADSSDEEQSEESEDSEETPAEDETEEDADEKKEEASDDEADDEETPEAEDEPADEETDEDEESEDSDEEASDEEDEDKD